MSYSFKDDYGRRLSDMERDQTNRGPGLGGVLLCILLVISPLILGGALSLWSLDTSGYSQKDLDRQGWSYITLDRDICPEGTKRYKPASMAETCEVYDSDRQLIEKIPARRKRFTDGMIRAVCHRTAAYVRCFDNAGNDAPLVMLTPGICSFTGEKPFCPSVPIGQSTP